MNQSSEAHNLRKILDWCCSIVGPCEIVSDDQRFHSRTSVSRLRTPSGFCYVKIHQQASSWEQEVHGYEQWAPAFGAFAPQLLAVHEDDPLALLVDELPGQTMEKVRLSIEQEQEVWHAAGGALVSLHRFANGECFGPCGRDTACIGASIDDATEYVTLEIERQVDLSVRAGFLSDEELAVIRTAQGLTPAFAGERPTPCHRDYGPANWLVSDEGAWTGVIDFEFARWDVRVADFSRYPNWEWIQRPDLLDAFFDGYGRCLTAKEEEQLLVARTQYALSAIIWGGEHSYHGFVEEGRQALKHVARLLA